VRLAAPKASDEKLSALFAVLELTAHRNHFPGELSLGLARRVALARAFAIEPDFLILDEPLASLDDALAARLRDQIATLVDSRSVTTLLVTHDMDDAIRLGDRWCSAVATTGADSRRTANSHTTQRARRSRDRCDQSRDRTADQWRLREGRCLIGSACVAC